jgi:hypothetical protein
VLNRSLKSTRGDTSEDDEYISDKTDIFSNALKEKVSTVLYKAKKETSEIVHSVTKSITKFELQFYKDIIFDTSPDSISDGTDKCHIRANEEVQCEIVYYNIHFLAYCYCYRTGTDCRNYNPAISRWRRCC